VAGLLLPLILIMSFREVPQALYEGSFLTLMNPVGEDSSSRLTLKLSIFEALI
jgi:hypothetical protein